MADVIKIQLKDKPVFSEEGIHIKTDKGNYSMYAVYTSEQISSAFARAKKGQCLALETEKGFDFNNASGIKKIKSCKSSKTSKN